MELSEFKESVADAAAILKRLLPLMPKSTPEQIVTHLELVQDDPAGLELLRNAIAPAK